MTEFWAAALAKASRMAEYGLLASYGAAAYYVYVQMKAEKPAFSLLRFAGLLFLAAFVGNLFGGALPPEIKFRDEVLMVLGFCTFQVLGMIEARFPVALAKYFGHAPKE